MIPKLRVRMVNLSPKQHLKKKRQKNQILKLPKKRPNKKKRKNWKLKNKLEQLKRLKHKDYSP